MSFFNNIESENLSARVTNKGRQKIAEGNFVISYFQIGDSEFDYMFPEFSGTSMSANPPQKVFVPLDKDSMVKYPYKLSESTTTGTTYGTPIQSSETITIENNMGAAGFVGEYKSTGSTIDCTYIEIDISTITGSTILEIPTDNPSGYTFSGCEFITLVFSGLTGTDPDHPLVPGQVNSLIYKIITGVTGVSSVTLTLDRNMPNLSGFTGDATVICNKCDPFWGDEVPYQVDCIPVTQNPEDRQDPWKLNIVWSEKPAGMDVPRAVDEYLSGYTSNVFVSTKEFLGYTSSSGQTTNTGTTIVNSLGDVIIVPPEEQHSLAIIHYDEINTSQEPEKFFKYEDYIAHTNEEDIEYFEIYIPFLLYHRNTGTTAGARFFMESGTTADYYINSAAQDTRLNKLKFRYLVDEQNIRVGKIFVHNKIVVFDDQEIVAALDYKSNRKHTLPIPRVSQIPIDIKCTTNTGVSATPLMSGSTGDTVFVSYLFEMTGNTGMTGLHCNHYCKVTGTTLLADISINFSTTDFTFLKSDINNYKNGYLGNKFYILAQKVTTGEQPTPDGWKIFDFTDEIPNHIVGDYITQANMQGSRFILTGDEYDAGTTIYDLEDYLGPFPDEPSTEPEFGDEQPFPGSIKLVRASDVHTMRFLINLPSGQFETTQNPTYTKKLSLNPGDSVPKRVTEVALLNGNKDVLVIAKTPKPVIRTGTQVFGVKIDF